MRNATWKRIGVAAPVAAILAAFGVLAAQAVAGGSGNTNLPVPSGMSVAVARGIEPISAPATAKNGTSLVVDLNGWQETAAIQGGERGSRRRF
ncbi:MAG TPA: hypothetical protein VGJ05_07505 [Fimbriiglobus sp.]|jgi:hypothetical protein